MIEGKGLSGGPVMTFDYDKLYGEVPDALGAPTPIFVSFFADLTRTGLRVLDVGCGQGRDALFIAQLGHSVVGVDVSPNGIQAMVEAAHRANLSVTGVVADIEAYLEGREMPPLVIPNQTNIAVDSIPPEQGGQELMRAFEELSDSAA